MKIIASGTFDRLHDGHTYFLGEAFNRGYVMVGLCADTMVKNKVHAEKIHPYQKRKDELIQYLASKGYVYCRDYVIKRIEDKFGFAITVEDIDAILVTPEVRTNAEEINKIRTSKGWNSLQIVEIPFLKDEKGVISSTRLRESTHQ